MASDIGTPYSQYAGRVISRFNSSAAPIPEDSNDTVAKSMDNLTQMMRYNSSNDDPTNIDPQQVDDDISASYKVLLDYQDSIRAKNSKKIPAIYKLSQAALGLQTCLSQLTEEGNKGLYTSLKAAAPEGVNVSLSGGAKKTSHSIQVTQLAAKQRYVLYSTTVDSQNTGFADPKAKTTTTLAGTGNTFAAGDIVFQTRTSGTGVVTNHTVAIAENDSLNDIANKINKANAGVTASAVKITDNNYQLVLESNDTGLLSDFKIMKTASTALVHIQLGQDDENAIKRIEIRNSTGAFFLNASKTAIDPLGVDAGSFDGNKPLIINGISITLANPPASLDQVVAAINSNNSLKDLGISAYVQTSGAGYSIIIQSKKANIEYNDNAVIPGARGVQYFCSTAQNSHATINGIDFYSQTNTITAPISGIESVELTSVMKEVGKINIVNQTERLAGAIGNMCKAYNTLRRQIAVHEQREKDGRATADACLSDSTALRLAKNLLETLHDKVAGAGDFKTLKQLGLELTDDPGDVTENIPPCKGIFEVGAENGAIVLENLGKKFDSVRALFDVTITSSNQDVSLLEVPNIIKIGAFTITVNRDSGNNYTATANYMHGSTPKTAQLTVTDYTDHATIFAKDEKSPFYGLQLSIKYPGGVLNPSTSMTSSAITLSQGKAMALYKSFEVLTSGDQNGAFTAEAKTYEMNAETAEVVYAKLDNRRKAKIQETIHKLREERNAAKKMQEFIDNMMKQANPK